MPAVARIGDEISTGHGCDGTSTIAEGSNNVFCNNIGVSRKGDAITVHTIPSGSSCVPHNSVINEGSPNVFVNNIEMARVGDSADQGSITAGSPDTFAN